MSPHAQGQHVCSFSVVAATCEATGAPHRELPDEAIRAADAAHMLSLRIGEADRMVPRKLDRKTVFAV
jgi:hypothetical protein